MRPVTAALWISSFVVALSCGDAETSDPGEEPGDESSEGGDGGEAGPAGGEGMARAGAGGRPAGGAGAGAAGGSAGRAGSGGRAGNTGSGGRAGSAGNGGRAGSAGTSGMAAGEPGASGNAGTSGGTSAPADGPPAGNPDGNCAIPTEANAEDTSNPTTVVGNGTKESCTSDAVVAAVAKGGVITFDCGPDPVTITMTQTAKVVNDRGPKIVIDGGGLVTLSGGGRVRILYQNTCDENQKWTTSTCQNQDHPQLTVQNLTFIDGNSDGEKLEGGGGGAIFVRGGRFKVINSRFFRNRCDATGPDVGGAAIRVLSQHENRPTYVVNSTFGGAEGLGNRCSNGSGLSSIQVSYTVINSLFTHNEAIGNGANPARANTPGGGSGGAIYNDGNNFTLSLCGTRIVDNHANEGGGAIFFVSNDRSGTLLIRDSVLTRNPSDGFETDGFPGIFVLARGAPQVENSTID